MQIFGSIDKQIIISGKAGVNQLSGLFGAGYKEPNYFSFTVTVAAGQTVNLQLSVHTGKTAKVQWDDGKETTVSYSAGDYTNHTNVYAAAGTYNIKIVDADNLKGFQINSPAYSVNIVGALPVNLTYLLLSGNSIAWTYSGALPVNLNLLSLNGNSIAWTYSGALPVNLTSLSLSGNSIAWTYSGALPVNLTYVWLEGNSIAWTYTSQSYKSTLDTFLYLPGAVGSWLSATIDQVIADLKTSGMAEEVNIAGNNEARTSASDQDLIDLRANGATVTVNEYIPFSFTVTVAAGETVNLQLSVHTGKTAKVQWDDGKETTVSYSAGDFISYTNVYAAAGTYNIKIVNADNLKGFRINNPAYSVNIVGALPVNLTYLFLYGNSIAWTYSGALPVDLTFLFLQGNSIAWTYTGALPVKLTYVRIYGSSIAWTYTSQSYKSTLSNFHYLPGTAGRWLSATVDQVIADLKTSTMAGTVDISGNNEARTIASDQDLIVLLANGADVTVNEY